jgi:excisionase family DNA binding protein
MQITTNISNNKFPYLTVAAACEYMGVDKGYLYANKHKIGFFQPTEGGKIWFKEESLIQFIANAEVKPSSSNKWTEQDQRSYIRKHLGVE